jgi:hypothetical protein
MNVVPNIYVKIGTFKLTVRNFHHISDNFNVGTKIKMHRIITAFIIINIQFLLVICIRRKYGVIHYFHNLLFPVIFRCQESNSSRQAILSHSLQFLSYENSATQFVRRGLLT